MPLSSSYLSNRHSLIERLQVPYPNMVVCCGDDNVDGNANWVLQMLVLRPVVVNQLSSRITWVLHCRTPPQLVMFSLVLTLVQSNH